MTIIWNSVSLTLSLGVHVPGNIEIRGKVEFNSKNIENGDIFVALSEAKGDGHDYVNDALKRGASLAIVSKKINDVDVNKLIYVNDTYDALINLAKYKRQKSTAKFIGITGSIGKTTTKDLIATLLKPNYKVFSTRGNLNNHVGMPLNLASIPDDLDYVVLELAMNHAGEIKYLSELTKPDIAIITNVEKAHLEFFNNILDIVDAKCEIVQGMQKNATILINFDSPYYSNMLNHIKTYSDENSLDLKICNFGVKDKANYRLLSRTQINENKFHLEYMINNQLITIDSKHIQEHLTIGFAIGLGVLDILKLNIKNFTHIFSNFSPIFGRGQLVNANFNDKNIKIICDHYNASPKAMVLSLKYLKEFQHENKIAIIADMLELGDTSIELHLELIPYILDLQLKSIILIGENCKNIYDSLSNNMSKLHFNNVEELLIHMDTFIDGNELILLKGSKAMNLVKILDSVTYKLED
jgi:UDP-N-acetylmuramoyl-tripeptide--D-alanyl-D-alanine ligase